MKRFMNAASATGLAAAMLLVLGSYSPAADTDKPAVAGASTINGKVLAADGTPAAGVRVALTKPQVRPGAKATAADGAKPKVPDGQKPGGSKPARPEPTAVETTNSDGVFHFNNVAPGVYAVIARDKGKGVGRARVTVADNQEATVEIKLQTRPQPGAEDAPAGDPPAGGVRKGRPGRPSPAPGAAPKAPPAAN